MAAHIRKRSVSFDASSRGAESPYKYLLGDDNISFSGEESDISGICSEDNSDNQTFETTDSGQCWHPKQTFLF